MAMSAVAASSAVTTEDVSAAGAAVAKETQVHDLSPPSEPSTLSVE